MLSTSEDGHHGMKPVIQQCLSIYIWSMAELNQSCVTVLESLRSPYLKYLFYSASQKIIAKHQTKLVWSFDFVHFKKPLSSFGFMCTIHYETSNVDKWKQGKKKRLSTTYTI